MGNRVHYSVEELRDWIEQRYNVIYQSKPSDYDIVKEAGLSWHRTQAANPKKEEDLVLLKREEIKKTGGPAGRNSRRSTRCLY